MQELTLEELKSRIVNQMDGNELLELIDIKMEDLVEALTDHIENNYVKILQELDGEPDYH